MVNQLVIESAAKKFSGTAADRSLSPGERVGVRASANVVPFNRVAGKILFILVAATLSAFAFAPAASGQTKNPPSQEVRESEYYRIVTLPLPPGVQLESGALQFLGPDTLACSTRIGDIWIA